MLLSAEMLSMLNTQEISKGKGFLVSPHLVTLEKPVFYYKAPGKCHFGHFWTATDAAVAICIYIYAVELKAGSRFGLL